MSYKHMNYVTDSITGHATSNAAHSGIAFINRTNIDGETTNNNEYSSLKIINLINGYINGLS